MALLGREHNQLLATGLFASWQRLSNADGYTLILILHNHLLDRGSIYPTRHKIINNTQTKDRSQSLSLSFSQSLSPAPVRL